MPNPTYRINIVKRGDMQSAVDAAAYQSGERLYFARDERYCNYLGKEGIVFKEILLPAHAPPEFKDRQTVWNSVEAAEPNWNSQLARRMKIALPRELTIEQNIALVREYCQKEFTDKGMIADVCVHDPDPPNHNPHFHVLLTMRPFDENGKWLPKAHKEYVLDEGGNKVRDRNGKWKMRKVPTVDWNNRGNAEIWRHDWEVLQNQYLEWAGCPERISMKSYERQGIDQIPTVHMGPAVTALERKGIRTDIGNLNREIKAANAEMSMLKKIIVKLRDWLSEIRKKIAELEAEPEGTYLPGLLNRAFSERKNERVLYWDNPAAIRKANAKDLQKHVDITNYLLEKKISTFEALEERLEQIQDTESSISNRSRQITRRLGVLAKIRETGKRRAALDPVHEKYMKQRFKLAKEGYRKLHETELKEWNKCDRYLRANLPDNRYDEQAISREATSLKKELEDLTNQLPAIQEEIKMMKDIRWLVELLLPESEQKRKIEPVKPAHVPPVARSKRTSVLEKLEKNKETVKAQVEHTPQPNRLKKKNYEMDIT